MGTFFLFPISADVFAVCLLVAIFGILIYFFVYKNNQRIQSNVYSNTKKEFEDQDSNLINLSDFGFPQGSSDFFLKRYINLEKGIAILRTNTNLGFALCSHAKLSYTRFYFFVDFSFFDRNSAVVFLEGSKGKTMLKINSESSMFSFDNIRFFDAKPSEVKIMLQDKLCLLSNGKRFLIDDMDVKKIHKSLNFIIRLEHNEGEYLKKWRNLNDSFNNKY